MVDEVHTAVYAESVEICSVRRVLEDVHSLGTRTRAVPVKNSKLGIGTLRADVPLCRSCNAVKG